ncbi:MAG: RagB/SusD family nutrient uptake outer membrane protein [Bacteroidaceae bacterium]|nr:RagB/SusD family nutrient uptake outer membrane protein [Bacteroidaceae bacterium]
MRTKRYTLFIYVLQALLLGGAGGAMTSCNEYLDVLPDNRASLDSEEKITDLLVSAYPETTYFMLAELYSDNTDRNEKGSSYTAFSTYQEQAATWQDVSEISQDTPYAIWEHYYKAIAAANNVIIAIDKLGNPAHLDAQRGEALLCRAYCHFILGNIFCMAYSPKTCRSELGITYITHAESEVSPVYDRGTLAELYDRIAADIETALPLVSDDLHSVVKYHFNTKAAYAFAARFYLYYMQDDLSNLDKSIDYASRVLGDRPADVLRDWRALGQISTNNGLRGNAFVDAADKGNLLILSTASYWQWIYGPTGVGMRYTHNDMIAETETIKSRGFWGSYTNFYFDPTTSAVGPKVLMYKLPQFFSYTDVTKGIGYPKMLMPVLTTDALILDRAEAYALRGDFVKAMQDLTTWMHAFTTTSGTVDATMLNNTYGPYSGSPLSGLAGSSTGMAYYTPTEPTPKKRLNPDFRVEPGIQENLIHAVLHARRVTCIHEGLRWFDVKRYGIEIYRRNIKDESYITVYDTMAKDDPRRAIQLPSHVITAGIKPNPR